jgi:hypothetical protein
MDDAMGLPPSKLGWIVMLCGTTGLTVALTLQWWINVVAYPIVFSGKPFLSLPAFIPVCFELTILFSAFGAVLGMLGLNQLPRFHHPVFYSAHFGKSSDDGFFLSVEAEDPLFDAAKTSALLKSLGSTHVELLTAND